MRQPVCLLCLLGLALAACSAQSTAPAAAPAAAPIMLTFADGHRAIEISNTLRPVAERVAPAYAKLTIYEKDAEAFPDRLSGPATPDLAARTIIDASAIIVDRRGYMVTAAHIAKGPEFGASVLTMDGQRREAEILHVDPGRELALLRIDPFPGMQPAVFADSDAIRRGDPAFAVGTPQRRAGVVAVGTVRLPKRRTPLTYGAFTVEHGIELDMAVETGDSGGPVFDRDGRLIGMVASYLLGDTTQATYVSPDIAFAVPANEIRAYVRERLGP